MSLEEEFAFAQKKAVSEYKIGDQAYNNGLFDNEGNMNKLIFQPKDYFFTTPSKGVCEVHRTDNFSSQNPIYDLENAELALKMLDRDANTLRRMKHGCNR